MSIQRPGAQAPQRFAAPPNAADPSGAPRVDKEENAPAEASAETEGGTQEEYPQGVSQMLKEVHQLLGKMGTGLPGFSEAKGIDRQA